MLAIADQPIWNPIVRMQADHAAKMVPSQLGTLDVQSFGSDPGPFETLLMIRGESCGGAIFTMSSAVARQIEHEGLSFFDAAEYGRGDSNDDLGKGFRYLPWQKTPIPDNWNEEGIYTRGFRCMDPTESLLDLIRRSTSGPGSYFSSAGSAQILVLPKSRAVLLTHSD